MKTIRCTGDGTKGSGCGKWLVKVSEHDRKVIERRRGLSMMERTAPRERTDADDRLIEDLREGRVLWQVPTPLSGDPLVNRGVMIDPNEFPLDEPPRPPQRVIGTTVRCTCGAKYFIRATMNPGSVLVQQR